MSGFYSSCEQLTLQERPVPQGNTELKPSAVSSSLEAAETSEEPQGGTSFSRSLCVLAVESLKG